MKTKLDGTKYMLKWAMIFVFALTTFATDPFFGSQASASNNILNSFTGNWRGSGLVKPTPEADQEAIRCRLRSNNGRIRTRLVMNGTCAVAGFVFRLNGWIEQIGSGNSYNASMFQSLVNISSKSFRGKRSGNRLTFNFVAIDQASKKPINASIQVARKNANRFDVQVSRSLPNSKRRVNLGTIKFTRR